MVNSAQCHQLEPGISAVQPHQLLAICVLQSMQFTRHVSQPHPVPSACAHAARTHAHTDAWCASVCALMGDSCCSTPGSQLHTKAHHTCMHLTRLLYEACLPHTAHNCSPRATHYIGSTTPHARTQQLASKTQHTTSLVHANHVLCMVMHVAHLHLVAVLPVCMRTRVHRACGGDGMHMHVHTYPSNRR